MERDYSDIQYLYGKPSVTTEEVYDAMMETEEAWAALGNEIWGKENPELSGMSLDFIKGHPVTDEDRETLSDIENKLWQMCHQLIHNCLVEIDEKEDEDTYSHTMRTYNKEVVKFSTSESEGLVWFFFDGETTYDDDEGFDLAVLFEFAQDIYHEKKNLEN